MASKEELPPSGPPRIALKLTPDGLKQQQTDHDYITKLVRKIEPNLELTPRCSPLITSQSSAVIAEKVALATKLDPNYKATNFDAWYQVVFESESSVKDSEDTTPADFCVPGWCLKLTQQLHNVADVESVHALQTGPPPAVNPGDDPRSTNQGYLDAAPGGINARYAWGFPGGDGAGANIIDVEQGWNLNHEDLAAANITLISGTNSYYFFHGTGVMGEILMVDNNRGGVGIAPAGKGQVISEYQNGPFAGRQTAAAILDAITHMSFGDVLLLEAQETDPVGGLYYWPVEIAQATYEAIRLATALGITVVEAGCNGGYDLDAYVDPNGDHIFDRSHATFRDSGAIMVGAATSAVPHSRLWFSNYGSRIDVYAWGENVDTTDTDEAGTDNTRYTGFFSGTSSASPIITGAAMIVQGLANAALGHKLSPLQVRKILTTDGTPSSSPATDKIGVQPDLKKIIDGSYINIGPDLYVRDNIADIGNTTSGSVSASPDIIIRQTAVSDPDISFGASSGTINNSALSQPVLSGHEHSLYIRALNRGGSTASTAKATVYWSPPATLVTPDLWKNNEIGTVPLPDVPTNRILTVSSRLAWPASKVPPTGHYCFIAIASANNDSAPDLPKTFPDWAKFVQNNNNVAWRNFNVISAPPTDTGRPFHMFPFQIPGAFDAPRRFSIKGLGSLPRGSEVLLRVPLTLARALGMIIQEKQLQDEHTLVPLHPFGVIDIGEGILGVSSAAKCELHIRVPLDTYQWSRGQFEFAISQEWEGIEVGRLTYRFGPEATFPVGGKDSCGGHEKCGCRCHHVEC